MTLPVEAEKASRAIRWVHLAFGVWLIASAFLLRHTVESAGNTWAMGLLTAIVALASLFSWHQVLRIDVLFSLWLLLSTLVVPYASALTQLHNALVAITLIVLAVAPVRLLARHERERGEGAAEQRAPA